MLAVGAYGHVDVFDFDRCTGLLSNYLDIGEHTITEETSYANSAFSPNGNVIYVSPFYPTKVFYQWDLNAGTVTDIRNSKTLINQYPDTGLVLYTQYACHNLAPDGKIYIPLQNAHGINSQTIYTSHLDVIENPDVPGTGCNYVRQGFDLGNRHVTGCLPNMAYFGLGPVIGSICDSLTGIKKQNEILNGIEVFPNPSSGIFYLRLKNVLQSNDRIVSVTVTDIIGSEILNQKSFSSTLDISSKSSGIYFVRVKTQKGKVFVAKIIKD